MNRYTGLWSIAILTLSLSSAAAAQASTTSGACDAYAVDVSGEVAAMAKPATALTADAAKHTALVAGVVYRLQLAPQQGYAFVAAPERRQLDDGAYAGVARFSVPAAGRWRISLGAASWIDVVDAGGRLVSAGRFEGHPECAVLRKWVEFPLAAELPYTLQLSGGTAAELTVLISGPLPDAR